LNTDRTRRLGNGFKKSTEVLKNRMWYIIIEAIRKDIKQEVA
jgi:hypothetical protein